jgi:hypothetical protein
MIPISIVVTAPHGISGCLVPPDLIAAADGKSLELIFADAGEKYQDQSRPGLTHLNVGGAGLFAMMQAGLQCARYDWIFMIEDHGRPLPGMLDTYRAAIAANPDVDLLFGGVENLTSVSPWSYACFFYNKLDYWLPARLQPKYPNLVNLMVRRAAILPSERAQEGGFQFGTCPRLLAAGQLLYCPEAVLDHVRWCFAPPWRQASTPRAVTSSARATGGGRTTLNRLLRDGLIATSGFTYHPWRLPRGLRDTPQRPWPMGLRLAAIGLMRAAGMLWAHIAGAGNSAVQVSADLAPK